MADKMMKVAGRSDAGIAKAIRADSKGNVFTKMNGVEVAEPVTLVENVSINAAQDLNVVNEYRLTDAHSFYLGVISDFPANVSLYIQPIVDGVVSTSNGEYLLENATLNANRASTKKYELVTNSFRVRMVNHSLSAVNVKLVLYKTNAPGKLLPDTISVRLAKTLTHQPITLKEKITVPAGTTINSFARYKATDCASVSFGVLATLGTPKISLKVVPIVDGYISPSLGAENVINRRVLNGNVGISTDYTLKSDEFSVALTNHSATEAVITLILYKSNVISDKPEKTEYYGATYADVPDVYAVPTGAFFQAVNTQEVWQSNGTEWIKI